MNTKINFKSNKFWNGIKDIIDNNAPTIATFGSVFGVGLTIYFAYKASKASAVVQEEFDEEINILENSTDSEAMATEEYKAEKNRIKLNKYLKLIYIYRWALLSGFASGGLAFLSNYLNGRTIAAITTLLATNSEKLKKGAEKVKEMVGEEKFAQLRDEINHEIYNEKLYKGELHKEKSSNKSVDKENDISSNGSEHAINVYFPDLDWMIEIDERILKDAIAEAERMEYLNVNEFRSLLGFKSVPIFNTLCWDVSHKHPFKAHFGWFDDGIGGCKSVVFEHFPTWDTFQK